MVLTPLVYSVLFLLISFAKPAITGEEEVFVVGLFDDNLYYDEVNVFLVFKTDKTYIFCQAIDFLSLVAFQFGGGPKGPSPPKLKCYQ